MVAIWKNDWRDVVWFPGSTRVHLRSGIQSQIHQRGAGFFSTMSLGQYRHRLGEDMKYVGLWFSQMKLPKLEGGQGGEGYARE